MSVLSSVAPSPRYGLAPFSVSVPAVSLSLSLTPFFFFFVVLVESRIALLDENPRDMPLSCSSKAAAGGGSGG